MLKKKPLMPFKADRLFQRRAALENLLSSLRYEHQRQLEGKGSELLLPLSRDYCQLLMNGIEAALAGKKNPFGIAGGTNRKQLLKPWDRSEAVNEFAALIAGNATTWDKALEQVATKFGVELKTIEDAYLRTLPERRRKDEIQRMWAESSAKINTRQDTETT